MTDEADDDGEISLTFTVPVTPPGQHTVLGASRCGLATATFEVGDRVVETVAPPPPPPVRTPPPEAPPPGAPPPHVVPPLPGAPPPAAEPPPPAANPPPAPVPQAPNSPAAPAPTRGSSLERYKDLLKRELDSGVILYNPPEKMRVGEVNQIEVRISRKFSDELSKGLVGPGNPHIEAMKVGTVMRAKLEGETFRIALIGSDVQQLADTGFREWQWEVTPTESGDKALYFVVAVIYDNQLIEQKVFDRRVDVAVNPGYSSWKWLSGNWQGLIAALVGLVGIAEAYRRLRRRGGQ